MIDDIKSDAEQRMKKCIESLEHSFRKIRTGRAHPAILDGITVPYYGMDTPLKQVASINVEDARTLVVSPFEKSLAPAVEKAIMASDLGLNPASNGDVIRVPMPMLTEANRKELVKQAKADAEATRVQIRNARRDANNDIKELLREKELSEDEAKGGENAIQKLTDQFVAEVDEHLKAKENDLMSI
ncbi:ribosome recycling factor [Tamilnaduibacter salinus]|uniref:Ribosome-recycling factor n=1 Tax=Tamilnaduibacter salinus TaxID=1484056 RepID=A0A2A2HZ07_9GAMM|nr:ribosome recycling factor [Tamilnaduibacter salinus]PAV24841.1 ribosome recycling factor [Tamilnaduibacter salinus]PVY69787.1 ribosome recycling factor [Tamilnaduibacter salinus]